MVVSDIGWMGELPSDVASKVPVEASASELAQACWELLEDRPSLEALGMRARRYSEAHGFSDAARALLEELERAAAAESDRSGRNTA